MVNRLHLSLVRQEINRSNRVASICSAYSSIYKSVNSAFIIGLLQLKTTSGRIVDLLEEVSPV